MKKLIRSVFSANMVLAFLLSGCVSASTGVSPTSTLIPTETPLNYGLKIASLDFQFQISEVALDQTVSIFNEQGYSSHNDGLVLTPEGAVPINATGDAVLILYLKLISGDKQKFLEFEPKIIEDNDEISAIDVITEDNGDGFFWIYDVRRSSRSFALKLPNGTLDLQPIARSEPETP